MNQEGANGEDVDICDEMRYIHISLQFLATVKLANQVTRQRIGSFLRAHVKAGKRQTLARPCDGAVWL